MCFFLFSDEEIGGADGMGTFSESPEFKQLNIGFAIDESAPNPRPTEIMAFHQERTSRREYSLPLIVWLVNQALKFKPQSVCNLNRSPVGF